jgi:TonB-dependent SusC/RagA subfamily outer membrane receptor
MRKTSRWMPVLLLASSAACAHDGVLAPELAPEPAGAELAVAATAGSQETGAVPYRISCSRTLSPREGGQQPLYVVDGVIEDPAADIRAGDIEGIQVMRSAEAAALYGARAANGVIVITTRAGKARTEP